MNIRSETSTDLAAYPHRWRALAVTQLAGFMSLLDVSIVNVALPTIARSMSASVAQVQWVVSGYALAFGLVLVAGGRLGDTLGRRRMFLVALSAFVLTSALCGAAPSAGLLVTARLLQGVAAGMLTPQSSGLIQVLFHGAERGRAFGIFGATVGLSTAVGPVLGGLILTAAGGPEGWRWIFYVNVPIGLVALVAAWRLVPSRRRGAAPVASQIDMVGALLLGAGVLCLLLPLVQLDSGGLRRLWWLFGLAPVLAALFFRWERRMARGDRAPLLDTRLLSATPGFPAGAVLGMLYFVGLSGIWLVLALYFQRGLGYTPLRSGLVVTPFALGSTMSAAVAGRLVVRYGRWLTVMGLAGVAVGCAATAVVLYAVPAGWAVTLPLFAAGVGGGAVISPNVTLTLECVPPHMGGAAAGALQTGQRIGSAIGTATLAAVFYHVVAHSGRYQSAIAAALLTAAGFVCLALFVAVLELRFRRHRELPAEPDEASVAQADVHRA
ncbi:MAG: MFS transporter [Pseudonocardiales bacterium]|nr:MFS transporter [Pseudonocardiales bacterium]MBV9031137.1 MFS transporter [Pseudonocardiales bacterium]MBW0010658.1 MFS transporter [Pseudonocardiales bacterium]